MYKKLILIFLLCGAGFGTIRTWSSASSTDMNLATNYSGSGNLLTTDTLLFDGTSVVNSTATASLSVGMIYKTSAYTGNWSVSGRRVTLNTGDFIDSSTTGTVNYGLGFTFLGSNVMFANSSTNGSISGSQCVITVDGHGIFYLKNNKNGLLLRRLNVKSKTSIEGGASTGFNGTDSVLVIDTGDTINIISTLSLYASATGHPFVFGNNITIDGTGLLSIKNNNVSGSIDISLPKIVRRYGITQVVTGTQMATFIATDTINVYDFRVYPQIAGSNIITFNSDSKTMLFKHLYTGALFIDTRSYCNFENSKLYVAIYTPFTVDSSFVNLTGCTIENPLSWGTDDKQVVTGSYQNSNVQDLLIGHSMVAEDTIREMGWFLKINHGDRSYVNKGVGGATIESALARIDSCINAYHPDRVYIWYGANDIVGSSTEDSTFMDTTNAYFIRWSQLINICIDSGITDIRSVGLAPRGTVSEPMSDLSVQRYKYFNSRMADSCLVYNIYYIDVFDSMLLAGYDNVVDTLCATDGIHVNSTLYGTERVASLMTYAYIPDTILINVQPASDSVLVGTSISFFIEATTSGDAIQYAMYRFGADTSIYYDSAVSFTATAAHHGDSIQFVAWNSADTVYSGKAYIGAYTMRTDSTGIYTGPYFKGQYDLEPDSVAIDGINMASFTHTDSTVYGPAPAPMMWKRGEEVGGKYLCRMYTPYGNHLVYVDLRKSGSVTVMKPTSINTSIGF